MLRICIDPAFHFDPDPTFHSDADPDLDPTFQFDPDPDPTTSFPDLYPPLLQNYPLRLSPFLLNADSDPDPAFHFNADPDPGPAFHFDADPDPYPASQNDADPDSQHCLTLGLGHLRCKHLS